jgi:hypothetical protein
MDAKTLPDRLTSVWHIVALALGYFREELEREVMDLDGARYMLD